MPDALGLLTLGVAPFLAERFRCIRDREPAAEAQEDHVARSPWEFPDGLEHFLGSELELRQLRGAATFIEDRLAEFRCLSVCDGLAVE